MHYGVATFATDESMPVVELARALEARGFESLWVAEHTHIPASRRTPWPGGGELPREYWHTLDPFVALTAAATATSRLKIGTGICLVVERDPITTTKEVASLDFISGGRFLFGIGAGWNVEEMAHHGTAFATRWKLLRERVLAMKKIWTEDAPGFAGELVQFEPLWSWPKPVQKPHPPVLLGAHGPKALARVVDYCEGWMPIGLRAADLPSEIVALRRLAAEKGRDPKSIQITLFWAPPDPQRLERLRAAGVDRVLFAVPALGADTILPMLDRQVQAIRAVG